MTYREVKIRQYVSGYSCLSSEERGGLIDATYGCGFHGPLARELFLFQCFEGFRMGDLLTSIIRDTDGENKATELQ